MADHFQIIAHEGKERWVLAHGERTKTSGAGEVVDAGEDRVLPCVRRGLPVDTCN